MCQQTSRDWTNARDEHVGISSVDVALHVEGDWQCLMTTRHCGRGGGGGLEELREGRKYLFHLCKMDIQILKLNNPSLILK